MDRGERCTILVLEGQEGGSDTGQGGGVYVGVVVVMWSESFASLAPSLILSILHNGTPHLLIAS